MFVSESERAHNKRLGVGDIVSGQTRERERDENKRENSEYQVDNSVYHG